MGRGIYLPSTTPDSLLMVNCLKTLIDAYPAVNFSLINFDEKLRGYKINFSEPDERLVLEKDFLAVGDRRILIYPLTTMLTVRGVPRNTSVSKNELKDAIKEKFGEVLDVVEVEQDWLVVIDIPEFSGLNVFHQESFRDMTLSLPKWNEILKVEFWCRHCNKCGHFQHECVLRSHPEISTGNSKDANSEKIETQPARNTQTQSISRSSVGGPVSGADEFSKKFSQKSINSIAERIGREEILNSGIISKENLKLGQTQSNAPISSVPGTVNHSTEREIKKENEDHDDTNERNNLHNVKSNYSVTNKDIGNNVIAKAEPLNRLNEDSLNSFDDAASNDDDIQLLECVNRPSPVNVPSHDSSTTGRDETFNSGDASPSNRTFASKPSSRVEVTSVLSRRLQDCINISCDTCKVLNRERLDAFLVHVKKKSNPERVALNYTQNSNGLKEQLQEILNKYYSTPQTGTKEDMQFIKWLNGLVHRFDGTVPRKRKRNERNSDESPSKK